MACLMHGSIYTRQPSTLKRRRTRGVHLGTAVTALVFPLADDGAVGKLGSDERAGRRAVDHRSDPHGDLGPRWKRCRTNTAPSQLIGGAPLDAPFLFLPFRVCCQNLNPYVGIPELKFLDGARELLDFIIAETREGVVRDRGLNGKQKSRCDENSKRQAIHNFHIVYLCEHTIYRLSVPRFPARSDPVLI